MEIFHLCKQLLFGLLIGVMIGAVGEYILQQKNVTIQPSLPPLREEMTNYRLIDPLLVCNVPRRDVV